MIYSPSSFIKDPEVREEFQKLGALLEVIVADRLPAHYRAPPKPKNGQVAIPDGAAWDPLNDGVRRPVWFDEPSGVWSNFGEGSAGGLVHAVVGTAGQISVDNTDSANPVLSLAGAVLAALTLANSSLQPGFTYSQAALDILLAQKGGIQYLVQTEAERYWLDSEFTVGHTILGVRSPGADVYIPADLAERKLVYIKDETNTSITVTPYNP